MKLGIPYMGSKQTHAFFNKNKNNYKKVLQKKINL